VRDHFVQAAAKVVNQTGGAPIERSDQFGVRFIREPNRRERELLLNQVSDHRDAGFKIG
jgi:hypothetical protein